VNRGNALLFEPKVAGLVGGNDWADHLSALRLFRYITVRSAGAAITALILSWWLGPKIIHWLKQLKFGQDYADKAEEAGGLARGC
jgi:phospho-N-acetylmuramoyl-pentapeptide-transferase